MAINKNMLFKLSGQFDKQVVFKQYGDKTVVSKYPDMSRQTFNDSQKRVQTTLAAANYEAKRIMADDELSKDAQVRLNVTRNKLYTALVKEYFREHKEKGSTE